MSQQFHFMQIRHFSRHLLSHVIQPQKKLIIIYSMPSGRSILLSTRCYKSREMYIDRVCTDYIGLPYNSQSKLHSIRILTPSSYTYSPSAVIHLEGTRQPHLIWRERVVDWFSTCGLIRVGSIRSSTPFSFSRIFHRCFPFFSCLLF